ncbi:hypothetical protein E4U48_002353 [Claviceps purpurea]|nr:hypothetical protein E4U27_001451 [Claviceps purpurea]KAG6248332.1 hypothetical protein E4U23_003038 [Claviceps purpurea]KAG6275070.1 hypothetical protein E4U48_002353 [Claviceps purpurea]
MTTIRQLHDKPHCGQAPQLQSFRCPTVPGRDVSATGYTSSAHPTRSAAADYATRCSPALRRRGIRPEDTHIEHVKLGLLSPELTKLRLVMTYSHLRPKYHHCWTSGENDKS